MIALRIDDHGNLVRLQNILDQVRRPRAIMAPVGREGANVLKKHFLKKDADEPNKLGGDRQHFWRQVAQGVQSPVVDSAGATVTIRINHPAIAQKVFGGEIRAKRGHDLAIPVNPDAYGRSPAIFEQETGLKLILLKQGSNLLLAAKAAATPFLVTEYLLTPSVHQEKDPTALPTDKEFTDAMLTRAETELERITNKS